MKLFDTNWFDQLEVVCLVIISAILGSLVGFERQRANKPAGIRTHAILASAATLLVGLSTPLITYFNSELVGNKSRATSMLLIIFARSLSTSCLPRH